MSNAQPTFSEAFQQGVREEMTRNDDIFVLGTDLFERGGHFAQVKGIGPEFGAERVRDTPISEAAMVAAGVGAAMYGLHPIVDLNFIDFAFGAMDEIVNQAAKTRYMLGRPVPLLIRATSGVALGGAHHQNSLEAWFVHTPGLAVVVPSSAYDVKGLVKTALRSPDPVIFLMHKRLSGVRGDVGGPEDLVPFGKARVARPGDDCTIVTYGGTVAPALKAAEMMAEKGTDVEVLDLRTLWPLDLDSVVAAARRHGRIVVADEAPLVGSVTAEIAAQVQQAAFHYLDAPVTRVGAVRAPIGASPGLIEAALPTAGDLVQAVESLFAGDQVTAS